MCEHCKAAVRTALGDSFLVLGLDEEPLSDHQKAVIRQTVLSALDSERMPQERGFRLIDGEPRYSSAWLDVA